jgi:hypothetical protein
MLQSLKRWCSGFTRFGSGIKAGFLAKDKTESDKAGHRTIVDRKAGLTS